MSGTSSNAMQRRRFGDKEPETLDDLLGRLEDAGGLVQDGPRDLMIVGWSVKSPEGAHQWSKAVFKAMNEEGGKFVAFGEGRTAREALVNCLAGILAGRVRWVVDKPWEGGR